MEAGGVFVLVLVGCWFDVGVVGLGGVLDPPATSRRERRVLPFSASPFVFRLGMALAIATRRVSMAAALSLGMLAGRDVVEAGSMLAG